MAKDTQKPEIKYIDDKGNYVNEGDTDAAFVINMNDPDAHNFVDKKKKAASEEVKAEPQSKPQAETKEVVKNTVVPKEIKTAKTTL